MKFYRFNLDTSTEYEAVRATVDAALGLTAPATCIQPYASGPTDQRGRVVLSISTDTPGYSLLVTQFAAVIAAGKARELTQDEYDYSLEPPVGGGGGGGGVSSWNDLTDRPFETVGTGLSVSSGAVSVSYGSASGTACQGDDARLSDARAPTSHASSHQTGGSDAVSLVVVTPSQLTANANDYAIGAGDIFRISANAARDITGIVAGSSGAAILLLNVGSHSITLKHQSTSSTTEGNRIIVPWAGDCVILGGSSALLVYDGDASVLRWRVV